MWAPEYDSLVNYLAAQAANTTQITALELRFGSTGRVRCWSLAFRLVRFVDTSSGSTAPLQSCSACILSCTCNPGSRY
jgi:hypothetical protein